MSSAAPPGRVTAIEVEDPSPRFFFASPLFVPVPVRLYSGPSTSRPWGRPPRARGRSGVEGDMRPAVDAFERDFARWGLQLPADATDARRGGQIRQAGWSIRYNFGQDIRGEYLDYYASPRDVQVDPPGDDWHVRLYASGERAS